MLMFDFPFSNYDLYMWVCWNIGSENRVLSIPLHSHAQSYDNHSFPLKLPIAEIGSPACPALSKATVVSTPCPAAVWGWGLNFRPRPPFGAGLVLRDTPWEKPPFLLCSGFWFHRHYMIQALLRFKIFKPYGNPFTNANLGSHSLWFVEAATLVAQLFANCRPMRKNMCRGSHVHCGAVILWRMTDDDGLVQLSSAM